MNNETKNKDEKQTKKFKIVLAIIAILLVFFIILRILKVEEIDTKQVPSVKTTYMHTGDVYKTTSLVGTINPADTYNVTPKVAGEILKIYVENGSSVNKGDKICEIDNSKQVDAAKIQLNTIAASYERMRKLYASGDISQQDFETIKAQYDSAKLQYDTQIEYSTVVAPATGVIENTNMTLDALVSQGFVLCKITAAGAKDVSFGVTERILNGINIGDEVIIEKAGKEYKAVVKDKTNLMDNSGLFTIKATVLSENNFSSGVTCKVSLVYDKRIETNVIEKSIIYYDDTKPYVYIVQDDNTLKKTFIEVGLEDDKNSEVVSGINKNDKILSTWSNDIMDGVIVNVIE